MTQTRSTAPDPHYHYNPNYMWHHTAGRYSQNEDGTIPYHARQDSTPFTYVRDVNSPNVLRATLDRSSGNTLSKVQTGVYQDESDDMNLSNLSIDGSRSPNSNRRYQNDSTGSGSLTYTKGPNNSYFYKEVRSSGSDDDSLQVLEDRNMWSPKSSIADDSFDFNGDSTWLRQQQKKLQEKKARQLQEEQEPYRYRIVSELKSRQTLRKPPVDEVDFHRSDISSVNGSRAGSVGRERPFMRVKRAYEQYNQQGRKDNFESDNESLARPETPSFPIHAHTPYSNISTSAVDFYQTNDRNNKGYESDASTYYGSVNKSTFGKNATLAKHHEVSAANVKIARDTSKYWYKPDLSREEVIRVLSTQPPGSFLVRNSNSFPGAFGLALKVSQVPPHLAKSNSSDELIRHFLIEPSPQGVRLKGSQHEPVFSSLPALIYQHSITQIALPCCLRIPENDFRYEKTYREPESYVQGAACNVLYVYSRDTESLTGPEAVKQTISWLFRRPNNVETTVVHFKVDGTGITLTDNKRKLFFRRHYPINTISYCGLCPEQNKWLVDHGNTKTENQMFAFVARKTNDESQCDNQCHIFVELEQDQPSSAIVNFINRVLSSLNRSNNLEL